MNNTEILTYDIEYNKQTGYYNIVASDGTRYGEYLTFDDANTALNSDDFEEDSTEERDIIEDPEQYVVCREYTSNRQDYFMFSQGSITKHVSYPQSSVIRNRFNDQSIKVYNDIDRAKEVATLFNNISRKKRLYKYTNWKAVAKWW